MKSAFLAIFCGLLLSVGCVGLRAQGIITGSLSGSVTDATGAVVPGATITVTDLEKGAQVSTQAQGDGNFAFPSLPIGTYSVAITATGFATAQVPSISITSGNATSLGKQALSVGGAATQVEVQGSESALLNTTQSQVTTTFDTQQIADLPTAGGFDELALLIPGVVNTHDDNFSNTNGANFSVNGERGRANNFEIDGQANNDTLITGPQVFFGNDEAIAEVQVITNSFGAQYGRNAGSVVNYITKSGNNSLHGSAIYKYSGDFTSSLEQGISKGPQFGFCTPGQVSTSDSPCSPTVVPRYVDNFWGGTVGGPILKDKLWFFGSTYWDREAQYGALQTSQGQYFPTTAGLAQLVAAFPNNPAIAVLQQLSPYAISGGNPRQIGASIPENITANGTTVPNVPFAQFGRQIPSLSTDQEDLGRLDWQASPQDRFYIRYFYQNNPTAPATPEANGGYVNVYGVTHSVGADETHTFGPHWVNQIRYSFQQATIAFEGGGFSSCTIVSYSSCPSAINSMALPDGTPFTSLGLASNQLSGRVVKVGQVQDNANLTVGGHTITFGGEFDYQNMPNFFLPGALGIFTYDSLDDFIAGGCSGGACSAQVASGNPNIPFKEHDVALYFQDDWKISSSFTANLGLRWEFFGQPINFLHGRSVAMQTGSNPFWDTSLPLSLTTVPLVANYYKNFEPRLGFAYSPGSNKRLVINGAYAINVDPEYLNIGLNVAGSAPAVASGFLTCDGTITCIPSGGANYATVQQQLAPNLPTNGNPALGTETVAPTNFRNPLGQTYTLGVQYQLRNAAVLQVRYVGNHTSRQFQSIDANPYLASVAAAFPNIVNPASLCSGSSSLNGNDAGFLSCGHTVEDEVTNGGFSQYQALQSTLTTRNFHGVTGTFSYTWSHNIDNTSEIYSTGEGGNTIAYSQNPLNTNVGERANSALDFPNTASISMIYAVPGFHTGNGLLKRLGGGWQANTVWIYNSGQPYTDFQNISNGSPAANPNDPATTTSYGDLPFEDGVLGADVSRPILSNRKAPAGTLGIYTDSGTAAPFSAPVLEDFNTGAVISPSQVRFIANNQLAANVLGNPFPGSSRNLLRGDTANNVDFSVQKNTSITERITFRLEVDAFNVLNRGFYDAPSNNLTAYAQPVSSFNNFYQSQATGASLVTPGTGLRNLLFVGKILF